MNDYYETVRDAAARAFWVSAWADWMEENDALPRGDLMDAAPETPDDAVELAGLFLSRLVAANDVEGIDELLDDAAHADRAYVDLDFATEFGHNVAMMAMGHGVGWFDDHAEFDLHVPDVEVYAQSVDDDDDDLDPETAELELVWSM